MHFNPKDPSDLFRAIGGTLALAGFAAFVFGMWKAVLAWVPQ
jgi:hypothetical protein